MSDDWKVDLPEGMKGDVEVRKFVVPEASFENLRLALSGRGCAPGEYTAIYRNGYLWMSDTSAEARDHFGVWSEIRRRGGRVLIMGLGLGMIVRKALTLDTVEHVDIVEIDRDVIDLVGPTYAADPRVTIHHGDAYTMKWPPGTRWNVIWHDIWPDLSTDNLPEMAKLARSYGRRCDWQGFWGKEVLLRHRRQERNNPWAW